MSLSQKIRIIIILGFVIGLTDRVFAFTDLPSCAEEPTYRTQQESYDWCLNHCSGTCVEDPAGVPNYCADGCCSYAICDPCADITPTPADQCGGSEDNVVHESDPYDTSSCDFSCKCPDYAGEDNYDFETCTASEGDCDDEAAAAATECGSLEQVVWDNVETCQYHCDQGDCEDEYQAAKQECDTPRLIDSLTCEYSCDCESARSEAEQTCIEGYFLNTNTCEYTCKCCDDKFNDCVQECGGSDNVEFYTCEDDTSSGGQCVVSLYTCKCKAPPIDDPEPDPDDGNNNPDQPDDGHAPDPDDDPDNNKDCDDYAADCGEPCTFSCSEDASGVVTSHSCDCSADPADPGPDGQSGTGDDGEAGSADDGANGWLKEIEENTDRIADNTEDANGWLKAIKKNTDEILEDTDNIAENVRRSMENDEKYFSSDGRSVFKDSEGKSVFVDSDGDSYLKKLTGTTTVETGASAENENYEVDFSGHGSTPDESDLPTDEELNSSFGTFTPAEEPAFIAETKTALESLQPTLVSPVCQINWNIQQGNFSYVDTWNFCQYESYLNLLGMVLVAMAAFYELYSLATG